MAVLAHVRTPPLALTTVTGFPIADTPGLPLSASLFALAGDRRPLRANRIRGALRHDHEGHR